MSALAPLLAWLVGCGATTELHVLDHAPAVPVTSQRKVKVDALSPTDLLARPDGTVLVLDGYRGRAVRIGPEGDRTDVLGDPDEWGRPVRFASAAGDTFWTVDPAGVLRLVDADGRVTRRLQLVDDAAAQDGGPPSGPLAMIDAGDTLVVSDRHGRVTWIDPQSTEVVRQTARDAAGDPLGTITDLAAVPGDGLWAADAVNGRLVPLDAGGKPGEPVGRYGLWVGYLKQPKAVLPVEDGGLLVADSALGVVQLFGPDGAPRGALTVDGELLRFEHPIALERAANGDVLVLDAGTATVWELGLPRATLTERLHAGPERWQRDELREASADVAGQEGENCFQCHDGLINDSRFVWDPARAHHPVGIKPERALPKFFPLSADGKMQCTTCHSPHGRATLAEVSAVSGPAAADALVSHGGDDEPFLRVSRRDSSLCVACHADTAHDDAVARLGVGGGAHPVGSALAAALKKRGVDPTRAMDQCLSCHAVHGAAGEHLTRDDTDGRVCSSCHDAEAAEVGNHPNGLTSTAMRPAPRAAAKLPLDTDGHPTCRTCHDLIGGRGAALLRKPSDGGEICLACHKDQDRESGHAQVQGKGGISCLGCHDPHGGTGESLARAHGASTAADPAACLGCHGAGGSAAEAGVRPGSAGHPVDGKAHEGLQGALTCATCHSNVHDPKHDLPECTSCHAEQAEAKKRGGHGRAACLDCHPVHGDRPRARVAGANPASQSCLACHAEGSEFAGAPTVASYTHPEFVFTPDGARWTPLAGLPLYSSDGRPKPAGQNGELVCSSCHETHGPDAREAGDSLRRPEWKEVCTSCHGADALVLYRYFHRPDRREEVKP